MNATLLRDIIFSWPVDSQLDEAKQFEARQIYSALDSRLLKRIITVEAAEAIAECSLSGTLFTNALYVIQLKVTPTNRPYAVIWYAPHWPESAEFALTRSDAAQARIADYTKRVMAQGRIDRIVSAICHEYRNVQRAALSTLLHNQDTEAGLKILVNAFEKSAGKVFYEEPK